MGRFFEKRLEQLGIFVGKLADWHSLMGRFFVKKDWNNRGYSEGNRPIDRVQWHSLRQIDIAQLTWSNLCINKNVLTVVNYGNEF
jgi:hypothetical protein